jgi:hypothetical protein
VHVTVAGKLNDATFQACKKAAEYLHANAPGFTAKIISFLPLGAFVVHAFPLPKKIAYQYVFYTFTSTCVRLPFATK